MTTQPLEAQARCIVDGEALGRINDAGELLADLKQASAFLPDEQAGRHEDLVKRFATDYATALGAVCAIFHERAPGHRLAPQFRDLRSFGAECWSAHNDKGTQVFPVLISLGMFPRVIGLANRLAVADTLAPRGDALVNHVFKQWNPQKNDLDDWEPQTAPIGMLTTGGPFDTATRELALDALMIAFFHEAAHALQGHLSPLADQLVSFDQQRAIESDADYGAGFYFCEFLPDFAAILGTAVPLSIETRFKRLSRGAFVLTSLLQALPHKNSKYHLPATRLSVMLSGAAEAVGLVSDEERARAERASAEAVYGMHLGLSQVGLDHYLVWDDPDKEADFAAHNTVTYPLVQQLRAFLQPYRVDITAVRA